MFPEFIDFFLTILFKQKTPVDSSIYWKNLIEVKHILSFTVFY